MSTSEPVNRKSWKEQRLEVLKALGPSSKQCRKCNVRKNHTGFTLYKRTESGKWFWPANCKSCGGQPPAGTTPKPAEFVPRPKATHFKEGYGATGIGLALDALIHKTQQAFFMKGMGTVLQAMRKGAVPFKEAACWAAVNGLRSEIEFLKDELLKNYVKKEVKDET